MSAQKPRRRKVGEILRIPLGNGEHAYAWTLEEPLVGFFEYLQSKGDPDPQLETLVSNRMAFCICVTNRALTRGSWNSIGNVRPPKALLESPWFFKRDIISGEFFKTRTGEEEVPIDVEEAKRLEAAAVWDGEHVEDRLRDHFAGRPNVWLESLRKPLRS